jgi:hypothetical protein
MSWSISRRKLLSVLGLGAAASVPVFRRGLLQAADPGAGPLRFVTMKYNNGTQPWNWFPEGNGSDTPLGTLPPLLEPFEAVKSKLLVFKGLAMACSQPGGSHNRGMNTLLTGTETLSDPDVNTANSAGGISVDQYIANLIGHETKFPSFPMGVKLGSRSLSFSGPLSPVAAESNPWSAYERLFAEIAGLDDDPAAAAELQRLREQRRSVLDHAADDIMAIAPRISADDRDRLDIHLDAIRQLEKGLDKGAADGCVIPDEPQPSQDQVDSDYDIPLISRLQLDLLVAALACDLTRISTFSWGWGGHFTLVWMGTEQSLHSLSHESHSDTEKQAVYFQALKFFSDEMAYFLERLDAIPGPQGSTLLDDSIVLVGTDNGDGRSHTVKNIPFLLAGSAGGTFRTGRYLEYPDPTPHNGLLISICEAMGTPVETFGNPEHCNGNLPNLT